MLKKYIWNLKFAIGFILFGGLIVFVWTLWDFHNDGFVVFERIKVDYQTTGQFGDFIGGVVGTLFALGGTLLIFLTFTDQRKQNRREAFEARFFEMIRLHRENVGELNYTKFDPNYAIVAKDRPGVWNRSEKGAMAESRHKKVFRVLIDEFKYCYVEVNKMMRFVEKQELVIKPKFLNFLQKIMGVNDLNVDLIEIAKVDISYSIFYYGLHREGKDALKFSFLNKYDEKITNAIIGVLEQKPKQEDRPRWKHWKNFYENETAVSNLFNQLLQLNSVKNNQKDVDNTDEDIKSSFAKYYGGQQHRLGHYFRHLFQSFTFVFEQDWMDIKAKYQYAKILRAQMSTYEQSMLFVNSLSTIGMKWEFNSDHIDLRGLRVKKNLITEFKLIKNLPGLGVFPKFLTYGHYYKKIQFESNEITSELDPEATS